MTFSHSDKPIYSSQAASAGSPRPAHGAEAFVSAQHLRHSCLPLTFLWCLSHSATRFLLHFSSLCFLLLFSVLQLCSLNQAGSWLPLLGRAIHGQAMRQPLQLHVVEHVGLGGKSRALLEMMGPYCHVPGWGGTTHSQMCRNAHEAAGEVAVSLVGVPSAVWGRLLRLCRVQERAAHQTQPQQRCLGAGPGSCEPGWLPSILHTRKRCLSRDTNT